MVTATGTLGATRIKADRQRRLARGLDGRPLGERRPRQPGGRLPSSGSLEGTAAHGNIRIGTVKGDSKLKASHGSVTIGEAGGDVDANLAYGEFEIERALASVTAKTAYGSIRLGEVSTGSIRVESGYGNVRIGIKPGVAAWLDLSSKNGRVRNELDTERAPGARRAVRGRARPHAGIRHHHPAPEATNQERKGNHERHRDPGDSARRTPVSPSRRSCSTGST